ncbi:ribulose-phosphate 3-epimerase [Patescibacteria group bacterium]
MDKMKDIIPAINSETFKGVRQKIQLVEEKLYPEVTWAQIDVSDGIFTKHKTWNNPQDLVGFKSPIKLEVHLMIQELEKSIDEWLSTSCHRIIFHLESAQDPESLIKKIHVAGKEAGLAIKPDTSEEQLSQFLDSVELIQFLAVSPGPSGQKFDARIFHKIESVRKLSDQCIIEIDGGINPEIAQECSKAGANLFVAGSSIFGREDIKQGYQELKNAICRT